MRWYTTTYYCKEQIIFFLKFLVYVHKNILLHFFVICTHMRNENVLVLVSQLSREQRSLFTTESRKSIYYMTYGSILNFCNFISHNSFAIRHSVYFGCISIILIYIKLYLCIFERMVVDGLHSHSAIFFIWWHNKLYSSETRNRGQPSMRLVHPMGKSTHPKAKVLVSKRYGVHQWLYVLCPF